MLLLTTVEEVRAYAWTNFSKKKERQEYIYEENAHTYVWRQCLDRTMTMDQLYRILYRLAYNFPYTCELSARTVYVEYLQAMQ